MGVCGVGLVVLPAVVGTDVDVAACLQGVCSRNTERGGRVCVSFRSDDVDDVDADSSILDDDEAE